MKPADFGFENVNAFGLFGDERVAQLADELDEELACVGVSAVTRR